MQSMAVSSPVASITAQAQADRAQKTLIEERKKALAIYPELRQKNLFDHILDASRVFPKPQLLSNKSNKVTASTAHQWTGAAAYNYHHHHHAPSLLKNSQVFGARGFQKALIDHSKHREVQPRTTAGTP